MRCRNCGRELDAKFEEFTRNCGGFCVTVLNLRMPDLLPWATKSVLDCLCVAPCCRLRIVQESIASLNAVSRHGNRQG